MEPAEYLATFYAALAIAQAAGEFIEKAKPSIALLLQKGELTQAQEDEITAHADRSDAAFAAMLADAQAKRSVL